MSSLTSFSRDYFFLDKVNPIQAHSWQVTYILSYQSLNKRPWVKNTNNVRARKSVAIIFFKREMNNTHTLC